MIRPASAFASSPMPRASRPAGRSPPAARHASHARHGRQRTRSLCQDGRGRGTGSAVGQPRTPRPTLSTLVSGLPAGRREFLLYLPLYNGVLGGRDRRPRRPRLEKAPPRPASRRKPIVFYGTSITQGGCASRPGMVHTAILGRRLDRPVINLGFSGNGRMEPELATLAGRARPGRLRPRLPAEHDRRRGHRTRRAVRPDAPQGPSVDPDRAGRRPDLQQRPVVPEPLRTKPDQPCRAEDGVRAPDRVRRQGPALPARRRLSSATTARAPSTARIPPTSASSGWPRPSARSSSPCFVRPAAASRYTTTFAAEREQPPAVRGPGECLRTMARIGRTAGRYSSDLLLHPQRIDPGKAQGPRSMVRLLRVPPTRSLGRCSAHYKPSSWYSQEVEILLRFMRPTASARRVTNGLPGSRLTACPTWKRMIASPVGTFTDLTR